MRTVLKCKTSHPSGGYETFGDLTFGERTFGEMTFPARLLVNQTFGDNDYW